MPGLHRYFPRRIGTSFQSSALEGRQPRNLSSLRVVAGGSVWNAAGRGIPVIITLIVTPFLVGRLGIDRWGLFTLALSLVGVAGILDLGVSRALTRSLSETIAAGDVEQEAPLVTTALWVLLIISGIGGAVATIAMPLLVDHCLTVPDALRSQAIGAFRVLSISTPLIVINVGLTGVVAAYQRYRALNLLVIPVTAAYFVLPALTLLVWDSLTAVMLSLMLCRIAYTIGCAWLCLRLVPGLWGMPRFRRRLLPSLLRVGAWIALSNTLSPMLMYADRFLIGALMPLAAVSYYATPFDVVARFTLLPIAVTGALFPAIAASFSTSPDRVANLLRNAAAAVAVLSFLPCLITVTFAADLLAIWLGQGFAAHSELILQLLACGMFFMCLSLVFDTLFDGTGRPDVGAKLMVAIALVFLPLSALGILWMGITGAAIVFVIRAVAGCFGRVILAHKYCELSTALTRRLMTVLLLAGLLLAGAIAPAGIYTRLVFCGFALIAFVPLAVVCLVDTTKLFRLLDRWRPGTDPASRIDSIARPTSESL